MALKASKLKQIPQRNKDLAFGYLRENENKNKSTYPQLIKYITLVYSSAHDQFDPNATHESLEIDGNSIVSKELKYKFCASYLKNVVSANVHVWKFRFNRCTDDSHTHSVSNIGAWKTTSGDTNVSRYISDTNKNGICSGYVISMEGEKTNIENVYLWSKERFSKVKNGDIIEMKLDLERLILKFKINDEIVAEFDNIEKTSYRAAVTADVRGDGFTLLSYQDIYS